MFDSSQRSEVQPHLVLALTLMVASCAHGPVATPVPTTTALPDRTATILAIAALDPVRPVARRRRPGAGPASGT